MDATESDSADGAWGRAAAAQWQQMIIIDGYY